MEIALADVREVNKIVQSTKLWYAAMDWAWEKMGTTTDIKCKNRAEYIRDAFVMLLLIWFFSIERTDKYNTDDLLNGATTSCLYFFFFFCFRFIRISTEYGKTSFLLPLLRLLLPCSINKCLAWLDLDVYCFYLRASVLNISCYTLYTFIRASYLRFGLNSMKPFKMP